VTRVIDEHSKGFGPLDSSFAQVAKKCRLRPIGGAKEPHKTSGKWTLDGMFGRMAQLSSWQAWQVFYSIKAPAVRVPLAVWSCALR